MPPEIANALTNGDPAPAGLTAVEKDAYDQMNALYQTGSGYAAMMVTRPQTLGYGLADSPVGLAALFYDEFADWNYTNREPERELTKDEMLDDISLYWLTNTATCGAGPLGRPASAPATVYGGVTHCAKRYGWRTHARAQWTSR